MTAQPQLMDLVSTGKIMKPELLLNYGIDGVGKTTFTADAPNPIFLGPESGSNEINTSRAKGIKTWADIRNFVKMLINQKHNFKTLGLDSIDWMEPLVWQQIMDADPKKPDVIDNAMGGYGKGYVAANAEWKDFFQDLLTLREQKGMAIHAIAHCIVKPFNDPTQTVPYDRYQLKLNPGLAAMWREFVDCVLFMNFEVAVKLDQNNKKKGKAYGEDKRVIYTQRRPGFDAKNRYGLPFEMALSYEQFAEERAKGNPDSWDNVMADLNELHPKIQVDKQEAMAAKILAAQEAKDINVLIKIRNYARTLAGDE